MKKKIKLFFKHGIIGDFYLFCLRLLKPSNKLSGVVSKPMPVEIFQNNNNATFFGYHDKTPFSEDNSVVLAMSVNASDKKPSSEGTPLKIGYFSLKKENNSSHFIEIGETNTWCWQQGCMLQWNPKKPNKEVVYNKLINGKYGSVIQNIETKFIVKEFHIPIYALSTCGNFAVSLNFSRLGRLRPGYGYNTLPDLNYKEFAPKDDGLFLFDVDSGISSLKVSLYDLAMQIDKLECEHYINHISFSPDSNFIVFFHVWNNIDKTKNIRFMKYDIQRDILNVIEEENIVSHYCWLKNGSIMVTSKNTNISKWNYVIYDLINKTKSNINLPFNTDGHPMQSPVDEHVFVIDTRLNKNREDKVAVFSLKKRLNYEISTFSIPYAFNGQVRCDLHPRWDRKGRYICADVVNNGKRSMALIDTSSLL